MTLEETGGDEKVASILGWVSLGTGLASAGLEMGTSVAARVAAKMVAKAAVRSSLQSADDLADLPRIMGKSLNGEKGIYITNNLYGEGQLAYSTHGATTGRLMSVTGKFADVSEIADEIAAEIGLLVPQPAPDAPLTLLACNGALSAGPLSKHLDRPIIAFHGVVAVAGPKAMEMPRGTWFTTRGINYSNHVTEGIVQASANGAGAAQAERLAKPEWFYPDNFFWRPWE